jgi:hypothetical protein
MVSGDEPQSYTYHEYLKHFAPKRYSEASFCKRCGHELKPTGKCGFCGLWPIDILKIISRIGDK